MDKKEEIIVVLNPGHAPDTPGKRSPDGKLLEWKWNLEAAEETAKALQNAGYRVEIVRAMTERESLTGPVRHVNNALCRRYGRRNVLFISLHCNAAGNGREWKSAKGWEIWTSRGETESDRLATCIFRAAENAMAGRPMRIDMSDGDPDKEKDFYVLFNTKCPAVLIESGFMDDKEECAWLLSDFSKQQTAEAVLRGLDSYLKIIE